MPTHPSPAVSRRRLAALQHHVVCAAASLDSVPLWPGNNAPHSSDGGEFQPSLDIFLHPAAAAANQPLGAVLIIPGGGYGGRATDHEGYQIAAAVNRAGLHAFVLQYRVAPNTHPAPLLDVSRGLRLIRARAEEWLLNPRMLAVLGFSAGGHLAASISVLHRRYPFAEDDDLSGRFSNRPDATILCYPVITSDEAWAHKGSFANLLGPDATEEQRSEFSLEKHIDEETPSAFLFHTTGDAAVPVENSLLYATGMRRVGTPFEMHVFPGLPHGIGLGDGTNEREGSAHVGSWSKLAMGWLRSEQGFSALEPADGTDSVL